MTFTIAEALPVLERTPKVLSTWLRDLPDAWVRATEGGDTWSAYDVVGHLIHGERTDWIPRLEQILSGDADRPFEPFDRFAQLAASAGRPLGELLDTFAELRRANVTRLGSLELDGDALARTGVHPEFGRVTLAQLLSTWVAHDLGHTAQIARVMAKRYRDDAGPWRAYLRILDA